MLEYTYRIYVPGGNDTALVLGLERDQQNRKKINDAIMEKHPNVEQVGFVDKVDAAPELLMAGGEFCGNASRTAAWYYLQEQPGEIDLKVSGAHSLLRAGVSDSLDAWAQMPVDKDLRNIEEAGCGFYIVRMEGITHVVVMPGQARPYLKAGSELTAAAKEILEKFNLLAFPAAGVLFLENVGESIKMHPCVYVAGVNTIFYETACGSGTIAVGLVVSYINQKGMELSIIQPSLKEVKAIVNSEGMEVIDAAISGEIQSDGIWLEGKT